MTATASATTWRNRIVGHADVPPGDLVPNPRNWRSHPQEQQRALSGALAEVGWVAEVLVNQTTVNVVDGHLRIELALARGKREYDRREEIAKRDADRQIQRAVRGRPSSVR